MKKWGLRRIVVGIDKPGEDPVRGCGSKTRLSLYRLGLRKLYQRVRYVNGFKSAFICVSNRLGVQLARALRTVCVRVEYRFVELK